MDPAIALTQDCRSGPLQSRRVEDAHAGPANEPIVERLVGAIDRGRIRPSQTIPDHMDYPADHTPVVHARNATRPREKGSMRLS